MTIAQQSSPCRGLWSSLTAVLLNAVVQSAAAGTVIAEVESQEPGEVRVALYRGAEDYADFETRYRSQKVTVADGQVMVRFKDLPAGAYAVSAYLDANGNGDLDRMFMGPPTEPYGFSRGARGTMSRPDFEDVRVSVSEDGRQVVPVPLE